MIETNHIQNSNIAKLDRLTNWLMAAIVIIPFIISFGALRDLAAVKGIAYPWLYPAMVDGGLIIFKAIVLRASLHGRTDRYAWSMAAAATAVSVTLNVLHVPAGMDQIWLARAMAALPPLVILAAFVAVTRRVRESVTAVDLVAAHDKAVAALATMTTARDKALTERDSLLAARDKAVAAADNAVTAADRLRQELAATIAERDKALATAASVRAQADSIMAERDGLRQALDAPAVALDSLPSRLAAYVTAVANGQTPNGDFSDRFGIGKTTLDRANSALLGD